MRPRRNREAAAQPPEDRDKVIVDTILDWAGVQLAELGRQNEAIHSTISHDPTLQELQLAQVRGAKLSGRMEMTGEIIRLIKDLQRQPDSPADLA